MTLLLATSAKSLLVVSPIYELLTLFMSYDTCSLNDKRAEYSITYALSMLLALCNSITLVHELKYKAVYIGIYLSCIYTYTQQPPRTVFPCTLRILYLALAPCNAAAARATLLARRPPRASVTVWLCELPRRAKPPRAAGGVAE